MHPQRLALLSPVIVALALAFPPVTRAQGVGGYPAGVQVGGGLILPLGAAASAMNLGWDIAAAGDIEFRPGLAIRLDYLYGRFGAEERDLFDTASLRAKTQTHLVTLDLAWHRDLADEQATFSLFGGGVVAVRRVQLTDEGGNGAFNEVLVDVCEPQWFQCAGASIPYHLVQGIRESTDLGANVGVGFSWDVGLRARLFAEARLVYIDGPAYKDSGGASRSADAIYAPLTAGLRFQW